MQREPLFVSAVQIAATPFSELRLTFDMPMDVGVLPAFASFEILIDAVPKTPTGVVWNSATELDVFWGFPDPAIGGSITLLVEDANLRGTNGTPALAPQTAIFFP